ncbi:hypothetical protein SAMN05421505_102156 [Sinosporangium album]|uniref:Lipoprotein LprG n=1 Tax=Sinosporangium album TaxID=504805 RepID=A0A1G7S3X2_9ACTN|nr:hypothetical protein [Sinosporangium album]SDG17693.1 hypothetical protein SAMN05421505_102156 [Sinosporangium album]
MTARRRAALAGCALVWVAGGWAAGCGAGAGEGPQVVTMAQAETLAGVRVRAYEVGGAHVEASAPFTVPGAASGAVQGAVGPGAAPGAVPGAALGAASGAESRAEPGAVGPEAAPGAVDSGAADSGVGVPGAAGTARVDGEVDWRSFTGRGRLSFDQAPGGADIAWTRHGVALKTPEGSWLSRAYDPARQPLDRVLIAALDVAGTRPDNPQLLQRNQAAHLRDDTLRGVRVAVYRGPAVRTATRTVAPGEQRTRYWVDGTGLLHRFEAALTAHSAPAVLDFTRHGRRDLALPAGVRLDPPA